MDGRGSSHIHLLQTAPLRQSANDVLAERFVVHRLWEQDDPMAYVDRVGKQVRGMATTHGYGRIEGLLAMLPSLEIISSFGVGYDHIDVGSAVARGIVVTNTPEVLNEDVADLAITLTMATIRQIPQADRYVREGRWLASPFPLSATIRGKTVGILGMGRIGKAIAARFEGFGVSIAYHAQTRKPELAYRYCDTPRALAHVSDILIVIVPGGDATRHLVDAEILAALGPAGVLINVSRGSVVDEEALIKALEGGLIATAGLDVYEDEPRVPDRLLKMDHLVLLPHIGSATDHTREAMSNLVASNLLSWFFEEGSLTPVAECRGIRAIQR